MVERLRSCLASYTICDCPSCASHTHEQNTAIQDKIETSGYIPIVCPKHENTISRLDKYGNLIVQQSMCPSCRVEERNRKKLRARAKEQAVQAQANRKYWDSIPDWQLAAAGQN